MSSYLPTTDAGLLDWSANFGTKISEVVDPTTIGLTADDVTEYQAMRTDYVAKYNAAVTPETRGGATILAKNVMKRKLIELSRTLAMAVTNNPTVTNEQRYAFGLTVREDPSPVPAPDHAPEIDLGPPVVRKVPVRLHNEDIIGRRGKPDGVAGALVFSYVGPTPPAAADTHLWEFEMNSTRTTLDIEFPSAVPAGATVWLTAFWYNSRGESGPPTPPVYTLLPGALQQAA